MIPQWILDFSQAEEFLAALAVLTWMVQYTDTSPWWNDPVGRTIMAKDFGLLLLLIPSCILVIWPHGLDMYTRVGVVIAVLTIFIVVMVWRIVVWYRIKPPKHNPLRLVRWILRRPRK